MTATYQPPTRPPTQARPHHDQFFGHADPARFAGGGPPNTITRQLCGAAYTDGAFAAAAITEVLEDRRRAVVPAIGYDLDLVLRHCLRARRLWTTRDAIVTALLLTAFAVHPGATFLVLSVALWLAAPAMARALRRRGWKVPHIAAAVAGVLLFGPFVVILPLLTAWVAADPYAAAEALSGTGRTSPGTSALLIGLVLVAVLIGFRLTMLSTLANRLAPGAAVPAPEAASPGAAHRLGVVSGAQHGNVVLHSGRWPFPGAGPRRGQWSVAVELRRERRPGQEPDRTPVPVDPVRLNRYVKRRLAALQSDELPERERIPGLALRDQIIAGGVRWHGYALVDQERRLPVSLAGAHAVEAVIRQPQAGVRHVLRATIGAESAPVYGADGRLLLAGESQGTVLSAFVHLAVEGGMLYAECITTVLGPIRPEFRAVDRFAHGATGLAGAAFGAGLAEAGPATLLAPWRLATAAARGVASRWRGAAADRAQGHDPYFDYGARTDVRELASAEGPATYLQELDADKYAKLLDRRIGEAIVEFLRDHGVDTAEFERRVNNYYDNSVSSTTVNGTVHGPVTSGNHNTVENKGTR